MEAKQAKASTITAHNCHSQGFLGVALKPLLLPLGSSTPTNSLSQNTTNLIPFIHEPLSLSLSLIILLCPFSFTGMINIARTHLWKKKTMSISASYSTLCFLIFILTLISAFCLSSTQNIEVLSGDDNVGSDKGSAILTSSRFLLGLNSSNTKLPVHSFSPAPAPTEEEEDPSPAPAPTPASHTRIYFPFPHKLHNQPAHKLDDGEERRGKSRLHAIIIAAVASAILVVIFSVAGFLVCKMSRRRRIQSSSGRNKVSYDPDPGPELFYLNSLAPILDVESSFKNPSQSKKVLSNENFTCCNLSHDGEPWRSESEPMSCRDEEILRRSSLSPFLGTKSSPIRSYEPKDELHNEVTKCDSDNLSLLDEEIIHVENLSSNDESFHSICNSRSSVELASVVSESNLSCASGQCSPYSSSTASSSPHCNITYSPSRTKHSLSPSQMFINKTSHSPVSSLINDLKSLRSSQVLPSPCIQETEQASKPVMISSPSKLKCTSQIAMTSLAPKSTALASPPQPPALPSVVRNGNVTRPPPPQMPSISNGNIPKPPPPPVLSISNGNIPRPPTAPLQPFRPPSSSQNGCNSSHPPPPPPPCQLQKGAPVGKDGTPLPKLKPLHWDKVGAAPDCSMVWDKIRSSSFELDEQMIESLFGYKTLSSVKNEEAKAKNSSPVKHVLDNKRLQNITILLKALNATSAQVCEAMIQGGGLSYQQLEALVKMAPTKEEEEKLSNYQGDIDELGSAEKFVKAILNIPFAFSRIQIMLYKETFEDEVIHLKKSFAMLEEACKELRSSQLFFRLLEAVLKTGNRMNVGTIRGGASAFKLDTLLKLADVKGTDGKTTLLHFVVQEMIRSEGVTATEKSAEKNKPKTAEEREEGYRVMGLDIVSELSTELCNVKKTASIDLDVLASSVSNLTQGMKHLKNLIDVDLSSDERNGSFVNSMKSFQIDAVRTIKELKEDEDQVLVHVREITEYYHGNVNKVDEANPLRIFVIVRDFIGMLDRVCKEVRSLKAYHGPNPLIPFR